MLYERGEDGAALAFIDTWLQDYPREGLMHCHISWHLALCALALGDSARAWRIYQSQVAPGGAWGPALNVATDAPAFLWCAELAGQTPQTEQWRVAHDYVLKSFPRSGIAFVDVHRALACIATGDHTAIAQLVDELERRARNGQSPSGDIVPRLARGLDAYGRGDWAAAVAILEPALSETVRIGGSRAQRDLIANTLLAACLKLGRTTEAHRLASAHAERRPTVLVSGLA